jgi:hypothetical protein
MISRLNRTVNELQRYIRVLEDKDPAKKASCNNMAQLIGVKKCVKTVGIISDDISDNYIDCLVESKSGQDVIACVKTANGKVHSLKNHIDNEPECKVVVCDYADVFDNWKMGCIVEAHSTDEANKCIKSFSKKKSDTSSEPTHTPSHTKQHSSIHAKSHPVNVNSKSKTPPKPTIKQKALSLAKSKAAAKKKAKEKAKTKSKQVKTQKELSQLKKMVHHLQHMKQHPSDTIIIPQAGPTTYNA